MEFEVCILLYFNITIRAYNIILPTTIFDRLNYGHLLYINKPNLITQQYS